MPADKDLLPQDVVNLDHDAISALFLGPKAENFDLLKELFGKVLDKQKHVRENYHREDKVRGTLFVLASTLTLNCR